jgi:hypothetical protein
MYPKGKTEGLHLTIETQIILFHFDIALCWYLVV